MNRVDQPSPYRPRRTLLGSLLPLLLVAAWLLASGVLGGAGPARSVAGPAPAPRAEVVPVAATFYVVQPGDTLWTVARSLRPTGEVRPLVDQLVRRTEGRPLRVGQRIPLP